MKILATVLATLAVFFAPAAAQQHVATPESLAKLDQLVQSLVETEKVVGAELLVIQHNQISLHRAYGIDDREKDLPMSVNTVFCVRSMTKPLIGTAALILIDEGKIQLDDSVGKYLPYLDVEPSRDITIRHLLNHNSGFPMSLISPANIESLNSIDKVAKLGAGVELQFAPGEGFRYSDQGTDTLTAVIEAVTEGSAEQFVHDRILEPLGMKESVTTLTDEHQLRERIAAKYIGSPGNWTKYWDASKPTLFPCFLGSQGLYCTIFDYARFCSLWLNQGKDEGHQLLNPELMKWALTPGPHAMNGNTGLPNTKSEYGSLMMVWTADEEVKPGADPKVIAFGHNGSDGTHAWVFPEQNAMAFYFTQSRGTSTGFQVEEVLGEVFLGVDAPTAQVAESVEPYLGYYREHEDDSYRAVVRDGEDLALEVPGKGVLRMEYVGDDQWRIPEEGVSMQFQRSEAGDVVSFELAGKQEFKFAPDQDLPTPQAVADMVSRAHKLDRLEELGPMQIKTNITFTRTGMSGVIESTYVWPNQVRLDAVIGPEFENVAFDGSRSWYHSRLKPLAEVSGLQAEQARLDNHFARFSRLLDWHPKLHVVQKLHRANKDLLLVRTNTTSAPARTLFIDAASGQVLGEDNVPVLDSLGRMGQRLRFNDFREIEGMLLPYQMQIRYSNKMIGTLKVEVTDVGFGADLAEGFFQLQG